MEQVTMNGRSYTLAKTEAIGGNLDADAKALGWDGNEYTLVGKRGAVSICYRSAKTGEFVKVF